MGKRVKLSHQNGSFAEMAYGQNVDAFVRDMELRDLPFVIKGLMRELPRLEHYRDMNINADYLKATLHAAIQSGGKPMQCWSLVAVEDPEYILGGGAAYIVPSLLSSDKVASDVFLYVLPEYRTLRNANLLIKNFHNWGRKNGAAVIRSTVSSGYRTSGMDLLMKRNGLEPIGTLYHLIEKGT